MRGIDRIRSLVVVGALAALFLGLSSPAIAQQTDDKDCSDFSSQEEAQQFFEQNGGPQSDPHMLDTDGDGVACEGLASSASPAPTATPSGRELPNNGIHSAVIALSGVTFLEAGIGLSLLARRMRSRRRLPLFLLKTLASAAREGRNEVALAEDVFVVRRTEEPYEISDDSMIDEEEFYIPATQAVSDEEPVETSDEQMLDEDDFYEPLPLAAIDEAEIDEPAQDAPPATVTGGRVYAAVAKGLIYPPPKPASEEPAAEHRRARDEEWPYFTPPGV